MRVPRLSSAFRRGEADLKVGTTTVVVPAFMPAWIAIAVSVLLVSSVATQQPSSTDLESYRNVVERTFLKDRGGTMPGYAACVMCHTWQTSLRFRLDTPATDAGWTPEQSRRNFETVTKVVNTASPENSWLLLKPLAPEAGGMGHTGGAFWKSRQDPEYQMVLKWIRSLPADRYIPPRATPIDFEFFRSCVQKVF